MRLPGAPTFLGKGRGGPRQEGHRHLHILPGGEGKSFDAGGPVGSGGFGRGGGYGAAGAVGAAGDEGPGGAEAGAGRDGEEELSPLREVGRVWRSWTPYLPAKKRGRGTIW